MGAGTKKAKRRRYRPLPQREAMYRRVLELHKEGRRQAEIIRKIEEEFGERLSRSVVSFWCRGIHRPAGRVRYELRPSPDLAWILGVLVGDGSRSFRAGSSGYYTIELHGRPELVKLFAEAVARAFGRDPLRIYPAGRGLVRASFQCAALYYVLSDFKELREFVESNLETVAKFLQGLWDAEGSIDEDGRLKLSNSDFLFLLWAQKLHSKLGIETTGPHLAVMRGRKFRNPETRKEYTRKKDVYYIYVRAKSLKAFYEKVGFCLPRKRRKLEEVIK